MTIEKLQFLELLKSGIWNSIPDVSLFSGMINWENIIEISYRQSVSGFVYDGIKRLPTSSQPHGLVAHHLLLQVDMIEKRNLRIIRVLEEFKSLCNSRKVRFGILKGPFVGSFYHSPNLRQSGDLDIFALDGDFDAIKSLLDENANVVEESNHHDSHLVYEYKGVIIELHFRLGHVHNLLKSRLWDYFIGNAISTPLEFYVDSNLYYTLPPTQNCAFLVSHKFKHFVCGEGIALKQFADWAVFLNANKESIDFDKLHDLFGKINYSNSYSIFCYIVVKYLGLPEYDLNFNFTREQEIEGDKVLDDILNWGIDYKVTDKSDHSFFAKCSRTKTEFILSINRIYLFGKLSRTESFFFLFSKLKSKFKAALRSI